MAGGFLPPVVCELQASTSEWVSKIAEAKEKLLGLHEGSDNDVPILGNIDDLKARLAEAKARLAEVTSQAEADPVVVRASVADFDAKMAEVRGAISDLRASTAGDQIDLRANLALLDADLADAKAKVDAVAREGSLNPIELRVATGDLDAKLAEADGKVAAAKTQMEATAGGGTSAFQKLSDVGGKALLGVAGAAAAVGAVSVDMGEKYQSATAQIAAASGTTVAQAQKVANAFLTTAGQSTFSAQTMAQAYGPVAGQLAQVQGHVLNAKQALDVMRTSSDLAEASGGDLASTTAALSATMQAYGVKAAGAAEVSDTLYNVSRRLNIPVGDVSDAMNKLHGRLGDLAPSMSDVGALMDELGQHGIQGSRGVQVVQTAMQTLVGGSKATQAELGALGVNIFDAQGKFVGMGSVVDQLKPKLAGMSQAQQDAALKTLFGASASQVMNSVISDGADGWKKAVGAVTSYGSAQDAAEKRSKTLHGETETLKSTSEDLAINLGKTLIPAVTRVAEVVGSATSFLLHHKDAAIALASVVGGILTVSIGTFAVNMTTKFIGSVKQAATSLGLLGSQSADTAAETAGSSAAMTSSLDSLNASVGQLTSALTGLDTEASTTAAGLSAAGTAAASAGGEMASAAGEEGAAGLAGGIGGVTESLGGMLGPIGLVGGLVGGLAMNFLHLGQSGPSAAELTAQAVSKLNQQLDAMPTSTPLQISSTLSQIAQQAAATVGQLSHLQTGSSAFDVAAGKAQALYTKTFALNAQSAVMTANINTLGSAFGLSSADVQSFAQQAGVNLQKSLNPTLVANFATAVRQSGQAFNASATASAGWATTLATSANATAGAMKTANDQMSLGTSESMTAIVHTLKTGGATGIAQLANSLSGGLPEVAALAHQLGVTIPTGAMAALQASMGSGGKVSMSNLIQAIDRGSGGFGFAVGNLAGLANTKMARLPKDLGNVGNLSIGALARALASDASATTSGKQVMADVVALMNAHTGDARQTGIQLVQGLAGGILANSSAVQSSMQQIITDAVGAAKAKAGIKSPSRVMADLVGGPLGQGVAVGIGGQVGQVKAAMTSLVAGAASVAGSAGQLTAGAGGPALAGPGPVGGNAAVNVTVGAINVNGATDPATTAQEVRTALLQLARQNGNLFGSAAGASVRGYGP